MGRHMGYPVKVLNNKKSYHDSFIDILNGEETEYQIQYY